MQGFCFHFFFCSLCLCLLHLCSAANSTVYLIRHGEKPSEGNGLDAQGVQRAQCLRTVFGKSAQYDIGYIIAEQPKASGARARPYETVEPLAQDLGLTVDTSCSKTDSKCVKKLVKKYAGSGNILICWEHNQLTNIVKALGDEKAPEYPDDSFDIIWTDPSPYSSVTEMTSECCSGIDSC